MGLATLTLLRRLEDRGEPIARQRITLVIDESLAPIGGIVTSLTLRGAKVFQEEYERDEHRTRVTFEVRTTTAIENHELAHAVEGKPGIKQIKIERL